VVEPKKNRRALGALAVMSLVVLAGVLAACIGRVAEPEPSREVAGSRPGDLEGLRGLVKRLRPLQLPLGEAQPGDWLAVHEESGQTFEEWLKSEPTTARGARRVIYVLPLGSMSAAQEKVVTDSVEYLRRYFQLPVRKLEPISEDTIPAGHKRDWTLGLQLHSEYILDEVLYPRVPEDAAALIALTAIDLYPQESWNFVFGHVLRRVFRTALKKKNHGLRACRSSSARNCFA